jgi:hypothetical protein
MSRRGDTAVRLEPKLSFKTAIVSANFQDYVSYAEKQVSVHEARGAL